VKLKYQEPVFRRYLGATVSIYQRNNALFANRCLRRGWVLPYERRTGFISHKQASELPRCQRRRLAV
jgi:hypothetical protein